MDPHRLVIYGSTNAMRAWKRHLRQGAPAFVVAPLRHFFIDCRSESRRIFHSRFSSSPGNQRAFRELIIHIFEDRQGSLVSSNVPFLLTVSSETARDVGPAAVARVNVAVRFVLRVVQHGKLLHLVYEPLAVLTRRRRRRHHAAAASRARFGCAPAPLCNYLIRYIPALTK